CTHTCNGTITPEEYPSLQNFSRTFTWNVRALVQETFHLDFTTTGLQQIRPTESCQDKHVYSVSTGTTRLGIFCRHGTIKEMQVLNEGTVSLWVPGNRQLVTATFGVSLGQEITLRCNVDLTKEEGLLIHIKKKKPTSACILKLNSHAQETVTIRSEKTSYLSFIDCLEQDLLLTINKTLACPQQTNCLFSGVSLKVPALEKCLLGVLEQVTWHLYASQHGTVELMSPMGGLQQLLPGQTCNGSAFLTVSEDEPQGITVGQFCPQGPIQKVQIRVTNLTVSACPNGNDLRKISYPLLNVSFTKMIGESYIFTVLPKKDMAVLLATPAWPAGMRPHSTVSWIVTFSSKVQAHVGFSNISRLTCQNRYACIKVQKQGSWDHLYSWKEDEKPKDIVVKESFYLNMSNCMPLKGAFSVVSQITLQTSKDVLVNIIISVVILLLLLLIISTVVCVIRKKKKQKASMVSVYNPNGHVFLPGLHGIPQTTEDEDFHIYHCIDDTLVYGHLLKDGMKINQFEEPTVDVYRDFNRPVDRRLLTQEREVEVPEVNTLLK
ncbi:hypothetical protein P4O66_010175, partial [Electrophorus voltai]